MKTLVVGDLHLKQQFVLPRIDGMLAGDAEIGRVVFLGDACDDWGANEADELNAMEFYAKWVREPSRARHANRRAAGQPRFLLRAWQAWPGLDHVHHA